MAGGPLYHAVRDGEDVKSIAEKYGFFWQTLWDHANNKDLVKLRGSPNVLKAGDRVFVPALRQKTEKGATAKKHRFKRKGVPSLFRVQLYKGGEPRKDLKYTLDVEGKITEGKTDANGVIEAPVSPQARQAKLYLEAADGNIEEYEIALGGLDPASEPSGARQRLEHLGFMTPDADDEGYVAALRSFQLTHELDVTGELDDTTQKELIKQHGT